MPASATLRSLPKPKPDSCVRILKPEQELSQLSKAVGTSPEVWKWIALQTVSTKHSYAARLLLALVIFEGYEIGGPRDPGRKTPAV